MSPIDPMTSISVDDVRQELLTYGFSVVRGGVELSLIKQMKDALAGVFEICTADASFRSEDSLAAGYWAAKEKLGSDAGRLLTIGRDLPAFSALVASPRLTRLIEGVLESAGLFTVSDSNVFRIDEPRQRHTLLDWHQDYPFNMLSVWSVTAWAPLESIDESMGPLKIVPAPEQLPLPTIFDEAALRNFHDSSFFRLRDADSERAEWESHCVEVGAVNPGDVVLFWATTIHASGFNVSDRPRFVFTARYASLNAPDSEARRWFTARAKYPALFCDVHPELVSLA